MVLEDGGHLYAFGEDGGYLCVLQSKVEDACVLLGGWRLCMCVAGEWWRMLCVLLGVGGWLEYVRVCCEWKRIHPTFKWNPGDTYVRLHRLIRQACQF